MRRLRLAHFAAMAAAILVIGSAFAQGGQTAGATTGTSSATTAGTTGSTDATTGTTAAQVKPPSKDLQKDAKDPAAAPAGTGSKARTGDEIYLTLACLAFGIIVMLIIRFSLPRNWEQVDITRVYGTPLLITGTIVLVAAGISQDAVAPAYGLFGTIAGFVLSKNLNENRQNPGGSKAEASAPPGGDSEDKKKGE